MEQKKIVPSLIISRTVTSLPTFLAGLLLVDIAFEFGNSVGVTGQIFTVSRFVGIFAALIVGHLSLKYAHKRLLIVGLLFEIVSAIGCYLSQNFEILMIAYVMSSIGYAIIIPMSTTLVREYYQAEQIGDILGKIVAGSTVIGIIGGPFFGYCRKYEWVAFNLSNLYHTVFSTVRARVMDY